jgi:hypothetical protein
MRATGDGGLSPDQIRGQPNLQKRLPAQRGPGEHAAREHHFPLRPQQQGPAPAAELVPRLCRLG